MELLLGIGIFIIAHSSQLAGFILPPFVDWLNREVPDAHGRFIVTLLTCCFVSIVIKWDSLVYGSPKDVAATLGVLFLESQVIFQLYFKNSWLREKINQSIKGDDSVEDHETMKVEGS